MIPFALNKMQNSLQVPQLLRQGHNMARGLPCKSSYGPQSNLSLRPLISCLYQKLTS